MKWFRVLTIHLILANLIKGLYHIHIIGNRQIFIQDFRDNISTGIQLPTIGPKVACPLEHLKPSIHFKLYSVRCIEENPQKFEGYWYEDLPSADELINRYSEEIVWQAGNRGLTCIADLFNTDESYKDTNSSDDSDSSSSSSSNDGVEGDTLPLNYIKLGSKRARIGRKVHKRNLRKRNFK
jgi:hypothetical protein